MNDEIALVFELRHLRHGVLDVVVIFNEALQKACGVEKIGSRRGKMVEELAFDRKEREFHTCLRGHRVSGS